VTQTDSLRNPRARISAASAQRPSGLEPLAIFKSGATTKYEDFFMAAMAEPSAPASETQKPQPAAEATKK